jgi:CHAD domain-containing protein
MRFAARRGEYVLPDEMSTSELRGILASHFELEVGASRVVERAYFDTFEGLVCGASLALLWEDGWLQLVDGDGRAVAAMNLVCRPDVVRASDLPPSPFRDRLSPIIGIRAATWQAHVSVRRQALSVIGGEGKTVVRLGIEEPSTVERGAARLATRLTLVGVRGYDKALAQVRSVITDALGLRAAENSVADETVLAAGGVPGPALGRSDIALSPGVRADCAASVLLRQLGGLIRANLPGTLGDFDTEFLHDLRVAVRRTRSLQRELKGVFPQAKLAHFRREFRWLQGITGPTRDLDVYLLEFDSSVGSLPAAMIADLEPLRGLLAARRDGARRQMVSALRSERMQLLLGEWKQFITMLPRLPEDDRADAARPIGELAERRIASVYRHMVKMGVEINDDSPPAALHDLRKRGKELRYLLEFFSGLFPAATVDPMIRSLKSLQGTLGRFQDHEVQAELLCSLGDEIATAPNGPATLMAMGVLVERLNVQQAQARAEFARRFAPFADSRYGDGEIKATLA